MSQLKNIILTFLFCLLFCTPDLYAGGSNELDLEKQKPTLSLGGIGKSFSGTVNGIGKFLGGTVNGIGKTLGGTINGIGEFFEENGETVVVVVASIALLYVIGESDCFYYDSGHHHGYHHNYHPK